MIKVRIQLVLIVDVKEYHAEYGRMTREKISLTISKRVYSVQLITISLHFRL